MRNTQPASLLVGSPLTIVVIPLLAFVVILLAGASVREAHRGSVADKATMTAESATLSEGENVAIGAGMRVLEDWEMEVFQRTGSCYVLETYGECLDRRLAEVKRAEDALTPTPPNN